MTAGSVATPALPPRATELLRSIDTGAVLGASRQLHVLGDVLTDVARARGHDPTALAADVKALVGYVTRTRGASSQAVANGIEQMARPVLAPSGSGNGQAGGEALVASVKGFRRSLDEALSSVRRHGYELLQPHGCILAYDYSSTVAQVVSDLASAARRRPLTVFVPEARSLDGGRKYLADWNDLEVTLRLVPDAALSWALSQCDAAVAGAETLSAEGGCYNTIGTALVAQEARRARVPFYVLSVLLKTDLQDPGGQRVVPSLDFLQRLEASVPACAALRVQGGFPDLDYTKPEEITGVVTEGGLIRPEQVCEMAPPALKPRTPIGG